MDNTIKQINITYIYINNFNEIEDFDKENYDLKIDNFISKNELIQILKNYIKKNKNNIKSYTITSLLKYNIDLLELDEIEKYLYDDFDTKEIYEIPFLSIIKTIDDIIWKPSLPVFKELNELFIIFYENIEIKNKIKKTKKIYLKMTKTKSRKII